LAAGTADVLKASAPFAAAWGWRNRDALAVVAACGLFAVFSCYSLWAEIGFAAEHRASRQANRLGSMEQRADLRRDYERILSRVSALGTPRSEGEIDKAVLVVLARPTGEKGRTVGQVSSRCTLDRKETREACSAVAKLAEEGERSREYRRLTTEATALRARLDGTPIIKGSGDAQLDALQSLMRLAGLGPSRPTLEAGLSLLVALLIELGSGVGLYIATTPWRGRGPVRRAMKTASGKPNFGKISATASVGAVDRYMLECVEPQTGVNLSTDAAYHDYQRWCGLCKAEPLGKKEFTRQFEDLAREAGIPFTGGRGQGLYRDVAVEVAKVDG
jgi:hypothetical protein